MSILKTSQSEGQSDTLPRPLARKAGAATGKAGRMLALAGVILPLLMIGGMKFTAVEIEALKPLIGGTPWLAWMYPMFGEAGAAYLLGVVEIAAALLLIACPWSAPRRRSRRRFGNADFPGDLFDHVRLADLGTDAGFSGAGSCGPVPDQRHSAARHRACRTWRKPEQVEQGGCRGPSPS
ncbi:YkgB family protein (plasmid) [Rhizobium sp. RCAM05350]|nr:YkgB family protein [Rhizobium sp. RCAM05350]